MHYLEWQSSQKRKQKYDKIVNIASRSMLIVNLEMHEEIVNEINHRPLILDIKGNSLDDGPGIRSVIFFKGCPLACTWCHNPESKRFEAEISFDAKACIGCDACLSACPQDALSRDNPFFIDRRRCDLCFRCIDACHSGALSRVGQEMGIAEIVARVLDYKPFYDTSGGGVTLSGGEPTVYMDFASPIAFPAQGAWHQHPARNVRPLRL